MLDIPSRVEADRATTADKVPDGVSWRLHAQQQGSQPPCSIPTPSSCSRSCSDLVRRLGRHLGKHEEPGSGTLPSSQENTTCSLTLIQLPPSCPFSLPSRCTQLGTALSEAFAAAGAWAPTLQSGESCLCRHDSFCFSLQPAAAKMHQLKQAEKCYSGSQAGTLL